MGKEWQYWCAAGGGSRSGRREAGSPSSCLSVVYQLFDFHRQVPSNFSPTPTSFKQDDPPPTLKGIEAPRNSLEMEEPNFLQAPSLSSAMKMEDTLHIPMDIQIKTRVDTTRSTTSNYSSSPDYLSSPSVKTPTLVARLMGLDLLPDTSSPSPSLSSRSSNSKPSSKICLKSQEVNRKDKLLTGVRSLPETPRVSSARKSDVDRRLSLQSNRDSVDRVGEIELSGPLRIRIVKREIREDDEVMEKVKQIKEGVSKRFGVEITNRLKNRGNESDIVLLKAKKPSIIGEGLGPKKYSMKLLEKEKHNQQFLKEEITKNQNLEKNVIKNKQTEPFVKSNLGKNKKADLINMKKRNKKMPLSTEFAKINCVSSPILLVKKEPSFLLTKLPPKQKQPQVSGSLSSKRITQLSSSLSHKYRQPPEDKSTVQCSTSDRSNGCASQEFFHYIKDILMHKGIYTNSHTPITKLSSMSLPLDPLIFNQLELSHSHFSLGSDRKLIFELVHEILGDIFQSFVEIKPLDSHKSKDFEICGLELIEKLRKKIDSFPLTNCQNLEDIDELIDVDLGKVELRSSVVFDEESEAVVEEIGLELLERIVQEVVMDML